MAKRSSKRASRAKQRKRRKRASSARKPERRKKIKKSLTKEKVFDFQQRKIRIKVVGIGGGGNSIVSAIAPKLKKIKFVAANTDLQNLRKLRKPVERFQFGEKLTRGLGTGMDVNLGERAVLEESEKIKNIFRGQDLSILISSLGGGTGSGAGPLFAKIAKDLKNYTIGIFTLPFSFEGEKRQDIARFALESIKPYLNSIIIFPNEKIFQIISPQTPLKEAFAAVNKILAENLEGLIEMLYLPGLINIDFADVKTILSGKGKLSFLNTVQVQGERRAEEGAKKILENPFYEYSSIGAEKILFNITGGKDLKITEVEKISSAIFNSSKKAKIIFGISENKKCKDKIKITLLAVGCSETSPPTEGKREESATSLQKKTFLIKKKVFKARKKIKKREGTKKPAQKLEKEFQVPQEKVEIKIRRNALDIKKESEKTEKEYLAKEAEWDIPTFLRKKSRR